MKGIGQFFNKLVAIDGLIFFRQKICRRETKEDD